MRIACFGGFSTGAPLCYSITLALLSVVFADPITVHADTLTIEPVADTTLIQHAPGNNLGGANFFNAGTAGNGDRNRALMRFDVAGIPAGSVISDVTLTLQVVRQPDTGMQNSIFSLRRVFQSWGEGIQLPEQSPGLGVMAAPGEATWNHRFAFATLWSQPGGQPGVDFSSGLSSAAASAGMGDTVTFDSTPSLIEDLTAWVNNPGTNFGWMLVTESEDLAKTARGFASRESGFGPSLTITFTPIPEPATVGLLGFGVAALSWTFRRRVFLTDSNSLMRAPKSVTHGGIVRRRSS